MTFGAFISYARSDYETAVWLHRRLERYRLPKGLAGRVEPFDGARRVGRVFLDRDELATSVDLGEMLRQEIAASRALVVVCSPDAAQSKWVNAEIAAFRELCPGQPIACVIAEGRPPDVFPPALGSVEPLAADLQTDGDGRDAGFLKLVSGLFGLRLGDLRDREAAEARARARRNGALATVFGALAIAAISAAGIAYFQYSQANTERQRAETFANRASLTALQTVSDVAVLNVEGKIDYQTSAHLIESALTQINATLSVNMGDPALRDTLLDAQILAVQAFYAQERVEEARSLLEEAEANMTALNVGDDAVVEALRFARVTALRGRLSLEEGKPRAATLMLTRAAAELDAVKDLPETGSPIHVLLYQTYAEIMVVNAEALEAWGRLSLAREAAENAQDILSAINNTEARELSRLNTISRSQRLLARIPADNTVQSFAQAGEEICRFAGDAYWSVIDGARDFNAFKTAIASQEECANAISNLVQKIQDTELVCLSFGNYLRVSELTALAQREQVMLPHLQLQILNNEIMGAYIAAECDSASGAERYFDRLRAQMAVIEQTVADSEMKTESLDGARLLVSRYEGVRDAGLLDRPPHIRPDGRRYDDPPPPERLISDAP